MTSLTVWRYDTAFGAEAGAVRLKGLEDRDVLTVHDAITVAWMPGADEPVIGRLRRSGGSGAGRGSLLGGLVGVVLLAPVAGAVVGAGAASAMSRMHRSGIDKDVVTWLSAQLAPGSSALLVLSSDADVDQLRPAMEREMARGEVALMHAQLSADAPAAIGEAIAQLQPGRVDREP